jgi:mRNA interferase RelE/StbE
MYKIRLTARAKKELRRISKLHRFAIGQILEDIKDDPTVGKLLSKELSNRYSYRISVYRIIYKINYKDKKVYIITVGHRESIYNR